VDDRIPDLRGDLSRETGRDVHILNDVTAASLYLARDCHWKRFMVVTVSSGIGTKVCVRDADKLLLFDKGPYAGEVGHIPVDHSSEAAICDCGGKGHLGAISSGRGIEHLARHRALVDAEAFSQSKCHKQFGATASTLTNEEHLVPAIRSADEWSMQVLRKGTEPLAGVLHTVMLALGLEGVFIIGGFAFSLGQLYVRLLQELIRKRCDYSPFRFSPDMICFGKFCETACLLGAAEYALNLADGRI
jgi:glucokinase